MFRCVYFEICSVYIALSENEVQRFSTPTIKSAEFSTLKNEQIAIDNSAPRSLYSAPVNMVGSIVELRI